MKMFLSSFDILSLLIFLEIVSSITAEICPVKETSSELNTQLVSEPTRTLQTLILECPLACARDLSCQSTNYFTKTGECQLLTRSHFSHPELVSTVQDVVYFPNALHPCTINPWPCLGVDEICRRSVTDINRNFCTLNYCSKGCSLGRPAHQSSTSFVIAVASNAVDGNKDGVLTGSSGSCTQTLDETAPWWRIDLDESCFIHSVEIANRVNCCSERLSNFEIRIGDSLENDGNSNPKCGNLHSLGPEIKTIVCDPPMVGKYLNIRIPGGNQVLTLCEVTVNP